MTREACLFDEERLRNIRRCTKCILPETFPLIRFDPDGVCNYCRAHSKWEYLGRGALDNRLAQAVTGKHGHAGKCLVPVSGGRDSSYVLHIAKKDLGLDPVAYFYDWGVTTPLAYRNIDRLCSSLDVPLVKIDPGLERKRRNIRRNLLAWLDNPRMSTVTLLMVGDKALFYHIPNICRGYGTDLILWGANHFERTDFKTAFFGIDEREQKKDFTQLQIWNRLLLAARFSRQLLSNPGFINRSLGDTAAGFFAYYFLPKNYLHLFHYLEWDEKVINTTLAGYGWETDPGHSSTWRIGDGTAALYNYIYCRVAGFSEADTFRSNQVREGVLTRSQALDMAISENHPREESIRWYCETVGVSFQFALETIHGIPQM